MKNKTTKKVLEKLEDRIHRMIDKTREEYRSWFNDSLFVPFSGGIDSSTVLTLATRNADRNKLKRSTVKAHFCTRKGMYEGEREDHEQAKQYASDLRVDYIELDVTNILEEVNKIIPQTGNQLADDERITLARTLALRVAEGSSGGLSLDTGNFTEAVTAQWTTGAWVGKINVIGCLLKTEVYDLARQIKVPERLIMQPKRSSELKEGALFTNYNEIDPILFHYLTGLDEEKIIGMGLKEDIVRKIIKRIKEHAIRDHGGYPAINGDSIGEDTVKKIQRQSYQRWIRTDPIMGDLHKLRVKRYT